MKRINGLNISRDKFWQVLQMPPQPNKSYLQADKNIGIGIHVYRDTTTDIQYTFDFEKDFWVEYED